MQIANAIFRGKLIVNTTKKNIAQIMSNQGSIGERLCIFNKKFLKKHFTIVLVHKQLYIDR